MKNESGEYQYTFKDTISMLRTFKVFLNAIYNKFAFGDYVSSLSDYNSMMIKLDDFYIGNHVIMMKVNLSNNNMSYMVFDIINNTLICNYSDDDQDSSFYDYNHNNCFIEKAMDLVKKEKTKIKIFNNKTEKWDLKVF